MRELKQAMYRLIRPQSLLYSKQFCEETLGKWFESDIPLGRRSPYDDRKICGSVPQLHGDPECGDSLEGPLESYLNQPHVQEALGFEDFNFSSINYDINTRFAQSGEMAIPT